MLRNRHGGNRRQPSAAIDHTTSLFVLPPNRHGGGRASSSVGSAPLRRLLLALPPSLPRSRRYPFALLGLRGSFAVSLLAALRFPSMRPPRASQGTRVICNVRCFFLAPLALSVPSGLGGACASCPRVGRSGFVFEPLRYSARSLALPLCLAPRLIPRPLSLQCPRGFAALATLGRAVNFCLSRGKAAGAVSRPLLAPAPALRVARRRVACAPRPAGVGNPSAPAAVAACLFLLFCVRQKRSKKASVFDSFQKISQ